MFVPQLVRRLLPALEAGAVAAEQQQRTKEPDASPLAESRVIVVSSSLHKLPVRFDFDDAQFALPNAYTLFSAYGSSKLANVLFTHELARRLRRDVPDTDEQEPDPISRAMFPRVRVNALHPGNVLTDVTRDLSRWVQLLHKIFSPLARLVQKSARAGAFTSVHVASAPGLCDTSGEYFVHCAVAPTSDGARRDDDARRLWALSARLVAAAAGGVAAGTTNR
jgi:NAD(P)-dependent dehydrogenase (short-subunit alcohol dehydrogenase family)